MHEPKDRSGETLFLRYAYPCAFDRLMRGHISAKHFDELTNNAVGGATPRRTLLRYCFPHAFRGLKAFAQKAGSERWSMETVQKFWRTSHGHFGECSVRLFAIMKIEENGVIHGVDSEGNAVKLINYYRLPLGESDMVYVHRRVIVERM